MSNKKNRNKKPNKNIQNFPFANEVKQLKENFKRSIDEMPDEDFIDMISYLMFGSEDFEDEDWTFDEEWEDEAEKFYNQGNTASNNDFNDDDLPF